MKTLIANLRIIVKNVKMIFVLYPVIRNKKHFLMTSFDNHDEQLKTFQNVYF